jgi:predicted CoA-binding protein
MAAWNMAIPPLSLVPRLAPGLWVGRFFLGRQAMLNDAGIARVLQTTRVVALVGWSNNPKRASHGVARYLSEFGYRVIPVNPGHAGSVVRGETVRASLSDIDENVDMIDIFRRSEHVLPIVQEALEVFPGLRTVWLQLGVFSAEAMGIAQARGLSAIENRCPVIEIERLGLAPGPSRV